MRQYGNAQRVHMCVGNTATEFRARVSRQPDTRKAIWTARRHTAAGHPHRMNLPTMSAEYSKPPSLRASAVANVPAHTPWASRISPCLPRHSPQPASLPRLLRLPAAEAASIRPPDATPPCAPCESITSVNKILLPQVLPSIAMLAWLPAYQRPCLHA